MKEVERMEVRVREEKRDVEGRLEERMKEREERAKEEKREMEGRVVKEMERRMVEIVREEVARMKEAEERGKEDGVTIPPVEYTIHNFSALKAQDKEWRSPPFYSHRGGYKMCIGVCPNGIGNCKGGALSILYYVMRDANTEGLRWPATLTVNVQVMNQDTKGWVDLHYQTTPQCVSQLQEKPSRESVLSFWNANYLNHNGIYRQHQQHIPYTTFVKDDCLHIRVSYFDVTYK